MATARNEISNGDTQALTIKAETKPMIKAKTYEPIENLANKPSTLVCNLDDVDIEKTPNMASAIKNINTAMPAIKAGCWK